jgi:hypothetical protein
MPNGAIRDILFSWKHEMPGFRPKNTRLGHVAEDLGLALLKGVALVAPVPYSEDYGIDAIVTLVRDFDRYRLIAEEVFTVQLKKASVAEITLDKDQIKWLFDLPMPLYFGSVDVDTGSIDLYNDQSIMVAEREKTDWESMTIVFNQRPTEEDIRKGMVSLGKPIHRWQLSALDTQECRRAFYGIVKAHVKNSLTNKIVRPVGTVFTHKWETGGQPESLGWMSARPPGATFEDIDDYVAPLMGAWSDQCVKDNRIDSLDDWISILLGKRMQAMIAHQDIGELKSFLYKAVHQLIRHLHRAPVNKAR